MRRALIDEQSSGTDDISCFFERYLYMHHYNYNDYSCNDYDYTTTVRWGNHC
jgi:hypothetical protein